MPHITFITHYIEHWKFVYLFLFWIDSRSSRWIFNVPNVCNFCWLSPTSSLAVSIRLSWSVFLQWKCNSTQWFTRILLVVLLKYVLIRFIAENDPSLVAFIAGRARSSFASWWIQAKFFDFYFFQNSPMTQTVL